MQITETVSEGLKRQIKVTIPADELKNRVTNKLEDIKGKVKLNGFRPGKVPIERVRQLYGRSVMAEVLEQTVGESSAKALEERKERPAFQPDIKLPEDQAAVQRMIEGTSDLEFTMSFEILPKIELADLKTISLTNNVAEPSDDDIQGSIYRLLKANISYETKDGEASEGDRLTIDYKGSIDGVPFEGGAGDDAFIVIGSGRFIPGFEDGLKGAKAGEERKVTVTFPEDYQASHLAGKDAVFDIAVKEVAAPKEPVADDEFAKSLGLESLDKLKDAIRAELQKELTNASKSILKRALLDALDEKHQFEVPPSLVKSEFDLVWGNVQRRMEQAKATFESEGTTEEKARETYEKMAERRVRLGLILSEIGNENQIKINEEELRRAVIERARQYPGQEREVLEFYRKNANAMNELRAPVYEDKVISFALELANLKEHKMSSEDLLKLASEQEREQSLYNEPENTHSHDHDHDCGPDCGHDHHHHDHKHA